MVESVAAAASTTWNSNSSLSALATADGAAGQWNVKGSSQGEVTAATAIAGAVGIDGQMGGPAQAR